MNTSIWTGYNSKIVLKESGNGKDFAVNVNGVVTLFSGANHAHPEEAAKTFFTAKMKEIRDAGFNS